MESVQCGPCVSLGKKMKSSHWCVICEEALCLPCKTNHLAMKISKKHEVVEISKMHKPITIAEQFCLKHASLPHEYFCIDHEILGCKDCFTTMHRTCQKIMSVDTASKGAKKSQSFIDSLDLIKHIFDTIHEITGMRERNIDDIKTKAEELKKSVREAKAKIVAHIESIEKSLLQELDQRENEIISGLINSNHEANSLKGEIKEKRDNFEMIEKHGSEKQAFLLTHSIEKDLSEAEKHVMSLAKHVTLFSIEFKEKNLRDVITSIGSIQVLETSGKIKFIPIKKQQAQIKKQQAQFPVAIGPTMPALVFENHLNIENVKDALCIRGMTVNDKNELILCDFDGNRLLVFDESNQYKYQINTKFTPWDIAVIPGTDIVVVTSYKDYIQFIDINRKKTVKQRTVEGSNLGGIAVSTEHVYVGAEGKIHVLDHQGHPVRTINSKLADRRPWFITLGNNGNIYYTDHYDVTCIKPDGAVVFTDTSPDLTTTWDIKTDNHDNVYVIDKMKKAIHRLRSDGTFIDRLEDKVLTNPLTFCFNRNYTKLFISNGGCSSISCFKLL